MQFLSRCYCVLGHVEKTSLNSTAAAFRNPPREAVCEGVKPQGLLGDVSTLEEKMEIFVDFVHGQRLLHETKQLIALRAWQTEQWLYNNHPRVLAKCCIVIVQHHLSDCAARDSVK